MILWQAAVDKAIKLISSRNVLDSQKSPVLLFTSFALRIEGGILDIYWWAMVESWWNPFFDFSNITSPWQKCWVISELSVRFLMQVQCLFMVVYPGPRKKQQDMLIDEIRNTFEYAWSGNNFKRRDILGSLNNHRHAHVAHTSSRKERFRWSLSIRMAVIMCAVNRNGWRARLIQLESTASLTIKTCYKWVLTLIGSQ